MEDEPNYDDLINQILAAYKKLDYRPNPRVHFDLERKECNPLVALVLAQDGIEPFLSMGRFFDAGLVHKKITAVFDWTWVEGFNDAFNMKEVSKSWDQNPLHAVGYKIGTEIRAQLREIYFRKPNPQ